jgi:ribonuclease T2
MLRLLLALLLLVSPSLAFAQSAQCSLPRQMERPGPEGPSKQEPKRIVPVGAYTLALSWSPQYCSTARGRGSAVQCGGRNGRFGFTLHGLWPDGIGKEWPQYCRSADLLPREVIRDNLCTTPSVQLLQHEWAKHGTCLTTRPDLYFNLSRAFYQSIRYPDMRALARQPALTVGAFAQAFARANPGLKPNMIRIRTTRGNWLEEVWLCMDKLMEFVRCPTDQSGTLDGSRLRIEPGPSIDYTKPIDRPAPKPGARPKRKPGLLLDLDPNVQPLTNATGN